MLHCAMVAILAIRSDCLLAILILHVALMPSIKFRLISTYYLDEDVVLKSLKMDAMVAILD